MSFQPAFLIRNIICDIHRFGSGGRKKSDDEDEEELGDEEQMEDEEVPEGEEEGMEEEDEEVLDEQVCYRKTFILIFTPSDSQSSLSEITAKKV